MDVAYLILTHNTPLHTRRLIEALDSPRARFFVHVDRKVDATPFAALAKANVELVDQRVAVHWGDFSQVDAIHATVASVLASGQAFSHLVLLSGADYPLRDAEDTAAFFLASPETEFMDMVRVPSVVARKDLSRLTTYRVRTNRPTLLRKLASLALMVGVLPKTRDHAPVFGDVKPYAGASWWALTPAAYRAVLGFYAAHPGIAKFYENTACADESYFQTAIGNAMPSERVRRNVTYADWSAGRANPAMLDVAALERLRGSPFFSSTDVFGTGPILFARKFADGTIASRKAA